MQQRGSDKHGPRRDEALAGEVEGLVRAGRTTRAEEWRDPEPPGEDQPDVDLAPDGTLVGGTPAGMTPADVEGRSELAAYLGKEVYPADRETLLATALRDGAPSSVLARLQNLPAGREFHNVQEVWTALGGGTEEHRN
jgi:Protein of unknown function (DUF2795)